MTVNTVKNNDMSTAAFLRDLSPSQQIGAPIGEESTGIFRHWTQKCYVSTAHFYTRLQHMLKTDDGLVGCNNLSRSQGILLPGIIKRCCT